jgi:hypothetical protein
LAVQLAARHQRQQQQVLYLLQQRRLEALLV